MIHCDRCNYDGYKTKAEFAIVVNKFLHTYKDKNLVERSLFVDAVPSFGANLCEPCLKYTKEAGLVQFDTTPL